MASRKRPFEVSADLYPFESNWFERDGSAMHYVDVGEGTPVLMLHGNPTWSFLYRDVIRELADTCRCIAPDYPGFGFSDHPPGYGYTPQEHADWVFALIGHLQLQDFVLVVQDWGGPIGMSIAVEHPERILGLQICNTWAWPAPLKGRIFSWLVGGPLSRNLHLKKNFFARKILPSGIYRKDRKTPEILRAYTDPFPDEASRMGTYVFPWAIRNSVTWLAAIENRLYRLRDKPVEIVWATRDPAFGREDLDHWRRHFPHGQVSRLAEASHYLQEDAPGEVAEGIKRLLERL